jgi:hypothetical protein
VQGYLYGAPRPLSDVLTDAVPVLSKVAAVGHRR